MDRHNQYSFICDCMFHTKICGVRKVADIEAVAAAGADAIGLNFVPPSPRFVDPGSDLAKRLVDAAKESELLCLGLFVNAPLDDLVSTSEALSVDAVQIHGDEDPEFVAMLTDRTDLPIIRAIKLPTGPLDSEMIAKKTKPWEATNCHLLFDADAGAAHGGSGLQLDWTAIRRWSEQNPKQTWTLAGGLNPDNVAVAITESAANSVDVASGVERPRGEKSEPLIRRFVSERKKAVI